MDEMRIKTQWMRTMIEKIIAKALMKKLGISVNLHLYDIYVSHDESGNTKVHLNINADWDKEANDKITSFLDI